MVYTDINFRTKKALKEAVKAGKQVTVYNPSGLFPVKRDGIEFVEMPHYPEPHRAYAKVELKDGIITKVF